jgi:Flp pilus assembly protein TadG
MKAKKERRTGATLVESAVVLSLLFLCLFGLILGSFALFHYHQVAQLAREGSRWASVHGGDWAKEQNQPATTQDDVLQKSVLPSAVNMDPGKLTCSVSWPGGQRPTVPVVDPASNAVLTRANQVSVTVSYVWDLGFVGPVTLSSTSVSVLHY